MDRKSTIDRLKKSMARTLAAFRWNRKTLSTSYAAGKWTAREVLAHLSDAELVFLTRLRFMLAEENPAVPAWDADRWASKFAYGKRDIGELRDTYALMRKTLLDILKKADATDLARPGRHPEYADYTVGVLAEKVVSHNEHHLEQLDAIKAGRTWAKKGE